MATKEMIAQVCVFLSSLILLLVLSPHLYSQQPPSAGETDAYVLAVVQDVLDRYPEDAESYFNAGQAHGRAGRYKDAIEAFLKGLSINPNRPDIYKALATLAIRCDREEEAAGFLQEAVQRFPTAPNFHERLGLALLHLGRLDEALAAFQKEKEISGSNPYIACYMGEIHLQKKEWDRAQLFLEEAVRLGPEIPQPYYSLAQVYVKQGNRLRAGELLQTFRVLKAKAEEEADRAPKPSDAQNLNRSKAAAHRDAGRAYLLHNELAKAEEHFRKAIQFDPEEVSCRAQLADMFLRGKRNYPEALELTRTLTKLAPTAAHYYLLSWACYENHLLDEAMAACQKSVELEPANPVFQKRYQQFLQARSGSK
ncbi:MAG: tetratricopeptide repeat protein [bacterium]